MSKTNKKILVTMAFVLCFMMYGMGVKESLIGYYPDVVIGGWILYSSLAVAGIMGAMARKYPMWIAGFTYGLLGVILYIV